MTGQWRRRCAAQGTAPALATRPAAKGTTSRTAPRGDLWGPCCAPPSRWFAVLARSPRRRSEAP
eukprot:10387821-Lingulodinium_polyedra.AAC.1